MRALLRAMRHLSHGQEGSKREPEAIRLAPLPKPTQFRAWWNSSRSKVIGVKASKADKLFEWFTEIEKGSATFDSLEDPGDFPEIDVRLHEGLTAIAHGELGRNIATTVERFAKDGKLARGRQLMWMVRDYHRMSEEEGSLYDLSDLMEVKYQGDAKLETFKNN